MTFYQEHIVQEAGFGTQTIRITVSDSVSGLYLKNVECNYECDCIKTDSTKETLTLADNKFGIGEMKFDINGAATLNSDGNKFVNAFLLEADDRTKSRFIAIFFNPPEQSDPDYKTKLLANVVFRGKINYNIQGKDIDWKGAIYSGTINPLRDWSFQALSIDFSLLEKILINDRITLDGGTSIRGIFGHIDGGSPPDNAERITTIETDAIFKPRLAYQGYPESYPWNYYTDPAWFYNHFYRLGSLFKAIQLLFNKGADILNGIYPGQNFTITLLESTLTLKVQPIGFGLTKRNLYVPYPGATLPVPQIDIKANDAPCIYSVAKNIQLKITQGNDNEIADDLVSPIFFHERMFDYSLNIDSMSWSATRGETEKSFGFRQYNNLSELLFEIARSLRCFVNLNLTPNNDIQVQFISVDGIVEANNTELIDVNDASINLSGNSNEGKPTTYYALANNLAMDGIDCIISKDKIYNGKNPDTELYKLFEGNPEDNLALQNWETKKDNLEKYNGIEFKRLLFSTSTTVEYGDYVVANNALRFTSYAPPIGDVPAFSMIYQPINIVHYVNKDFEQPPLHTVYRAMPERLHTGLYIRVKKNNMAWSTAVQPFYDVGTDDNLFCPCHQIHIKYDDVEKTFITLTEYINYSMGIDEQFYIQEYSLTIPYWNGFKILGTKNWKNIKLGSKIYLTWNVITWNGTDFVEAPITKIFIVNEVERKWQNPETNLKLHYEGRFSFTQSSSSGTLTGYQLNEIQPNFLINNVKEYIAASTITSGDAVRVFLSNNVVKVESAIPMQAQYGECIGIALNSCEADEACQVQVMGTVFNNAYDFTGHIGEYVYCQNKAHGVGMQGNTNISTDLASPPAGAMYDSILLLGKIDSLNSFVLGIVEIPFEVPYSAP